MLPRPQHVSDKTRILRCTSSNESFGQRQQQPAVKAYKTLKTWVFNVAQRHASLLHLCLPGASTRPNHRVEREHATACVEYENLQRLSTVVRLNLDSRRTYRIILMQNGNPSDDEGLRNPENNDTRVVT